MELQPRLFLDFSGVTSCLIIRDPDEYLQRVMRGIDQHFAFEREWEAATAPLMYCDDVDPTLSTPNLPIVPFTKHFRFAYQCEWRVVFAPAVELAKPPSHITLELGDLSDICSVEPLSD
jgi:hypothetical protein